MSCESRRQSTVLVANNHKRGSIPQADHGAHVKGFCGRPPRGWGFLGGSDRKGPGPPRPDPPDNLEPVNLGARKGDVPLGTHLRRVKRHQRPCSFSPRPSGTLSTPRTKGRHNTLPCRKPLSDPFQLLYGPNLAYPLKLLPALGLRVRLKTHGRRLEPRGDPDHDAILLLGILDISEGKSHARSPRREAPSEARHDP